VPPLRRMARRSRGSWPISVRGTLRRDGPRRDVALRVARGAGGSLSLQWTLTSAIVVAVASACGTGSSGPAADPGAGGGGFGVGGGTAGVGGQGSGGTFGSGGQPGVGGRFDAGGAPSVGAGGGTAGGGTAATGGRFGIDAGSTGGTVGSGGTGAGGAPPTCPSTLSNPTIWEDLADLEVIRVDDTYYYTASTMHYSPGAPILRSKDLVSWEYVGHAVPALDYDPKYSLTGGRAYVNGIWASSLRYRPSNGTFYWIGCMHNVGGGYVYTATSPEGPWTKHKSQGCYYDVGLLIDDDDKMYTASGNTTISVAELSADGFSQVRSQQVFTTPSNLGPLEGSRFYKFNGNYYILTTQYANGEYVLRSTSGPFGPYELKPFAVQIAAPVPGAGHPHQGGIVQTQNGDWYYTAFIDAYPGGRVPVFAPVTWSTDGWPSVVLDDGKWGASYPFPNLPCGAGVKPLTGVDTFAGAKLGPEWEWNHNPDDTKWSAGGHLTLQTATVTSDLYAARNTLTHRILGPTSTATIALDTTNMRDGDRAGLALLRDSTAWIGVKRDGGAHRVAMVNDLKMDQSWNTTSTGTEVAGASVSGGKIWLRVAADIRPGAKQQGHFYYSMDGSQFTELGSAFTLNDAWQFFMGYRFAIFDYATLSLGGSVELASFELATP
jgi:beta-xylosidase